MQRREETGNGQGFVGKVTSEVSASRLGQLGGQLCREHLFQQALVVRLEMQIRQRNFKLPFSFEVGKQTACRSTPASLGDPHIPQQGEVSGVRWRDAWLFTRILGVWGGNRQVTVGANRWERNGEAGILAHEQGHR